MTTPGEMDLRALVRDLIREALPLVQHGSEIRRVTIANDADLAAFVDSILLMATDPQTLARYRAGEVRFEWQDPLGRTDGRDQPRQHSGSPVTPPQTQLPQSTPSPVMQVDTGAVTERMVARAAADGARVLVGKGAVVTPLARELARKSGVTLERLQ